jgi:hypothetical protein
MIRLESPTCLALRREAEKEMFFLTWLLATDCGKKPARFGKKSAKNRQKPVHNG